MIQPDDVDRRTPVSIDLDRENGLMRIVWADERACLYSLPDLRRRCPCAGCSGEGGRAGLVNAETVFTQRQVTLEDVRPLNRFGLQFIWGDGHDDGLYSYAFLRDLCRDESIVDSR